ncbi:hypothetical protein ABZ721_15200 [Streptomyces sp. NPDC006733]|uniref:hypothetical protein n=1 Tax=Streptomyces sp. NPDC006733 TaxID=3155460 RepID=UPI0033FB7749
MPPSSTQPSSGAPFTPERLFTFFAPLAAIATIATIIGWIRTEFMVVIAAAVIFFTLAAFFYIAKSADRKIQIACGLSCLLLAGMSGAIGFKWGRSHALQPSVAAPGPTASKKAGESPGAAEVPPPAASTGSQKSESPYFSFSRPVEGSSVDGTFEVSGEVRGIGTDNLWLLDYSGSANSPGNVYYRTSDHPVAVREGTWSTTDGPLGGPSDIGAVFAIAIVRATPHCSATIGAVKENAAGDFIVGSELPEGCSLMGTRHVKKKS